ncbi:uclacyanin 1-like [Aegilops tauschii subsp. strangulata]|uniref:uclacyanin 1-like n=1 Tax=Aegilops tauschii subsp. strangulata TaxID=200361 RepID=UPI001ABD3293|nr:blue copper protein-like [Aegilops tauschii subsp. strangulata]
MRTAGSGWHAVTGMAVSGRQAATGTWRGGLGEPGGAWGINTDYARWVADKKFQPGDEIVFKYSPTAHDVVEVSKAGYDSCSTDNAINTFSSGNDVVALNATGTRYFICGFPDHCVPRAPLTMKIVIDIVSGSSSSSPASPMPAAGPGASSSPLAPPSSAATSLGAAAGFGVVALLAAGLMA